MSLYIIFISNHFESAIHDVRAFPKANKIIFDASLLAAPESTPQFHSSIGSFRGPASKLNTGALSCSWWLAILIGKHNAIVHSAWISCHVFVLEPYHTANGWQNQLKCSSAFRLNKTCLSLKTKTKNSALLLHCYRLAQRYTRSLGTLHLLKYKNTTVWIC
jgi:hypothetical protein